MKPAFFHPRAREALRAFPEEVKKELGKAILDLQKGQTLRMPLSRPMPTVAPVWKSYGYKTGAASIALFISKERHEEFSFFTLL